MTPAAVFAPGKLFVIGEYAVLGGARALVAATSAGIRCKVRSARSEPWMGHEERSRWSITAPDLRFMGSLGEAAAHPRARLLAAAASAAARRFGVDGPLDLLVEGTHPATRAKRGVGGSAAATVAVVAAVGSTTGAAPEETGTREAIFEVAREVHRDHQHGRGSGADVAASVFGGWVEYSLGEDGPRVRPAPVSEDLGFAVVWSGSPSDTGSAIAGWSGNGALSAPLERFWRALEEGDRETLLRAVCEYGDALGVGSGASAARIAALVGAAREAGAAAKGSGAVGGDCVVALAFDPVRLDGAAAGWRRFGAEVFDLAIDGGGVRREGCGG